MNKELVSQLTHMQESVVWEQFVLLIALGGLKVANTTAQAFAKKTPVVVISEAPGANERTKKTLLHHKVRDFDTQLKVFEQFTVASTVLNDPLTACHEIDRVL